MSLAYVLINAEIGKEKLCYNEVKQLGSVKEVYILYGFYDIIAIVESSNINNLIKYVLILSILTFLILSIISFLRPSR